MTNPSLPAISERLLINILLAVQFINFVDYMMVMPLAPDFAAALGFSVNNIGIITGAYALASALVGFIAALTLDYVSRKRALIFCLFGTSLLTFATAFATDLDTMIALRFVTGLCAGPLTGIAGAFVADYVPPERRGAAMGKLMGALALGSVLGVPVGLELARHFNWQAPFLAVGGTGLITCIVCLWLLPFYPPFAVDKAPLRQRLAAISMMVQQRLVLASFGSAALAMLAAFLVIPHIAAHVQLNMDFPREDLSLLYLLAGGISFFSMRWAGRMVDNTSATRVGTGFSIAFMMVIFLSMVLQTPWFPVMVMFPMFMICMSGRGVASQTLASRVPAPEQRGSYMAIQSSVIGLATAIGAILSGFIVHESDGRLQNMEYLGMLTIAITLIVPFLLRYVEKRLSA